MIAFGGLLAIAGMAVLMLVVWVCSLIRDLWRH